MRNKGLVMSYVNRLEDRGMRKILTLRILYDYSNIQIAKALGIQSSTAEKIAQKGALKIKRMMYKDLEKKGKIINA